MRGKRSSEHCYPSMSSHWRASISALPMLHNHHRHVRIIQTTSVLPKNRMIRTPKYHKTSKTAGPVSNPKNMIATSQSGSLFHHSAHQKPPTWLICLMRRMFSLAPWTLALLTSQTCLSTFLELKPGSTSFTFWLWKWR